MRLRPAWWIGLCVWIAYNAIIFGTWAFVAADYTNLAGRSVILERLILPEFLGAALVLGVVTWLGWWRPVLREQKHGGPQWALWVLLLFIAPFCAVLLSVTQWSEIALSHLATLVVACLLIGINEELLTRGIVLVGLRGSTNSEALVWLGSTALFGLMHVPNGFFGISLSGGLVQAVFTFLLGSGLYLLRRVSGTIFLPIAIHALWDFSSFSHQVTGEGTVLLATFFQFLTYLVAMILIVVLFKHDRKRRGSAEQLAG